MKLIIAGGRNFKDYLLLKVHVSKIIWDHWKGEDVEIISGGQVSTDHLTGEKYGADYFGELYAAEKQLPVKRFPADWKKYGRPAGMIRNKQMVNYASDCICFWDGQSPGTKNMIELCKTNNIPCTIIRFDK